MIEGEAKEIIQLAGQFRVGKADHAQHSACLGNPFCRCDKRTIPGNAVTGNKTGRLKVYPSGPFGADLFKQRPAYRVLWRAGIKVGPDRPCAMCVGGLKRKLHPRPNILAPPAGRGIPANRAYGAVKSAIGIWAAAPDVPLVQMGVHVDKGGEGHCPLHVDGVDQRIVFGNLAVFDGQADPHKFVYLAHKATGHSKVIQPEGGRRRQLHEIHFYSRFSALSCQLRRAR